MTSEDMLYKLISFLDNTDKDFEVFDKDGNPITKIEFDHDRIYLISDGMCCDCDCCVASE